MFCLQIHALAGRTMNSKFSILHSATPRAVLKISHSLCGQRVRVFVNKTLTTVSPGGGTSYKWANGDVPLDGVAFS